MRVGDTQTDTLYIGDGSLHELAEMIGEDGQITADRIAVDTECGQLTIQATQNGTVRVEQ